MPDEEKDEVKGPDFVIVDRRVREPEGGEAAAQKPEEPAAAEQPEAEQDPVAAAEEHAEEAEAASEEAEAQAADIADVYGTIGFMITLLNEQAWHLMGLVPNPITKEYKKDLGQAQVAIDCVGFLVGKLEGRVTDDDMRRLRTLVADLQVNFAKQKTAPES